MYLLYIFNRIKPRNEVQTKNIFYLTIKMSSANVKYSEAVKRLEEILENVDRSNVGIDELADLVKEASDLIKTCRSILTNTERNVQEALEDLEG